MKLRALWFQAQRLEGSFNTLYGSVLGEANQKLYLPSGICILSIPSTGRCWVKRRVIAPDGGKPATFNTLYGSVLGEAGAGSSCGSGAATLSIPSTGRCWVKLGLDNPR